MTKPLSREEFVEMLTLMSKRSRSGSVLAARTRNKVGSDDAGDWASLLEVIHGKLYLDDSDDPVTREGGVSSAPLYELDKIDSWPDGKWQKLSRLIWWIDPQDEIPVLDVIAETPDA
jgi:hypothetical protein